jgi:hypothetical protein
MKTCTRCGARKRSTGFYTNSRTKDGLRSECKDCSKTMTRLLRERKKNKALGIAAEKRDNKLIKNLSEVMEMWQNLSVKMQEVVKEAKTIQMPG